MARIGKQIPHFQEIEIESIKATFSVDKTYRYTLTMDYKDSLLRQEANEKICVILKNPSSADEKKSDNTIRKVETYIYKHFPKVKTLSILNMFAIRATDVKEVNQLLKENSLDYITGSDNNKYFHEELESADHIICAWGNNNGIHAKSYFNRIEEVKSIINQHNISKWKVNSPKSTKQPLHGLMWGFNYELEKL